MAALSPICSAGPADRFRDPGNRVGGTLERLGCKRAQFSPGPPGYPGWAPALRFTSGQRSSARRSMSWSNGSMRARSSASPFSDPGRHFRRRPGGTGLCPPRATILAHGQIACHGSEAAAGTPLQWGSRNIPAAPTGRSATFLSTFGMNSRSPPSGVSAATISRICPTINLHGIRDFAPCCRQRAACIRVDRPLADARSSEVATCSRACRARRRNPPAAAIGFLECERLLDPQPVRHRLLRFMALPRRFVGGGDGVVIAWRYYFWKFRWPADACFPC